LVRGGVVTRRIPYQVRSLGRSVATVDLAGRRLTVPAEYRRPWASWQPNWRSQLLEHYAGHGVFFDVGANLGQTLADHLGSRATTRYLGFEPVAESAAVVQKILRLNRLDGAVLPVALSDEHGTALLYLDRGKPHDDIATLRRDLGSRPGLDTRYAVTIPGDRVWEGLGRPDVSCIKIDVEGSELPVLTGLREVLSRVRPVIICEVLHAQPHEDLDGYAARVAALGELLASHDYVIHNIARRNRQLVALPVVDRFPVVRWRRPESFGECDYLLMPAERD
jgi:FkbM family methyltransferase